MLCHRRPLSRHPGPCQRKPVRRRVPAVNCSTTSDSPKSQRSPKARRDPTLTNQLLTASGGRVCADEHVRVRGDGERR